MLLSDEAASSSMAALMLSLMHKAMGACCMRSIAQAACRLACYLTHNLPCRSLYAMLLSDEAASSSKAALMLSLVHKAMGADLRAPRVAAFAKRLLQPALAHAAPFACGCLILVSDVLQVSSA